jgi:hypothetical protein
VIGSTLLRSDLLASCRLAHPGGGKHTGSDIVLGYAGRCPLEPTHLILNFDNSGSVGSAGGNDPIGNRFAEARLAIEAVSRRCRCDRELVSIVHFDCPTSGDVPPSPLNRQRSRQIERGLAIPPDGAGASLLGPSLQEAYRLAERFPDHQHVLCVLSDFLLFDDDLPKVLDDFSAFPGTLHAVVLRATPPSRLLDDGRIQVTSVDYTDRPGAVAQAVFGAATTHRRQRRHRFAGRGSEPTGPEPNR